MKNYLKGLLLLLLLWSSACSPADDTGVLGSLRKKEKPPETCCVLTGHRVQNSEGELLGIISSAIVDTETGDVTFVIVAVEDPSIWGKALMVQSNKKFIPLPWSILTPAPQADAFVLKADLPLLLQAPRVDQDIQSLDEDTRAEIDQFWTRSETEEF